MATAGKKRAMRAERKEPEKAVFSLTQGGYRSYLLAFMGTGVLAKLQRGSGFPAAAKTPRPD